MRQRHLTHMKRLTTSTTPLIRSWKSKHITNCDEGRQCDSWEDKQIQQKGRQDASTWASEMKDETLVEWATSTIFKIMYPQFQKKAGRRWTCRSPDGNTKNEIDYSMTDKPSMVTDVTVINRLNIGGDHRVVMGSVTLNTKAERMKPQTRVDTQMIGTKKNMFQIELKNSTRRENMMTWTV